MGPEDPDYDIESLAKCEKAEPSAKVTLLVYGLDWQQPVQWPAVQLNSAHERSGVFDCGWVRNGHMPAQRDTCAASPGSRSQRKSAKPSTRIILSSAESLCWR